MTYQLKNDLEDLAEYLKQFKNNEQFCDLAVCLDEGDIEMAASLMVHAGAIDSDNCYEEYKSMERDVEHLASEYKKQTSTHKKLIKRLDSVFSGYITVECKHCNNVQFVSEINFSIYEEELKAKCWECHHTDCIDVEPWKVD